MNPWEVLGIRPGAPRHEIADAYRVLAQIFHPDRYAEGPEKIREEAERRMQTLNEAYHSACNGGGLPVRGNGQRSSWASPTAPPPRPGGPATRTRAASMSWESAARYRATLAARYRESQEAEERSLPKGIAVARPKPLTSRPSTLLGLGLARNTNKLRCRGCNSIQLLPEGWREGLASKDYHCSLCGRRILAR
ncbi:MAG TPA: J domain-containing protein [Acidimicrobiales bacterium]|jgi:hypothetical protein|nr:J domain-containing protein [Acidimicrobiales bacterium]